MAVAGSRAGTLTSTWASKTGFRPAEKAHPALVVEGLDALVLALAGAGYPVQWDDDLPEVRRCFVADPFGNRIELIEAR